MWSYPKGFFVWFWVACLLPKIFSREMVESIGRFFWLGCEETGSEPPRLEAERADTWRKMQKFRPEIMVS